MKRSLQKLLRNTSAMEQVNQLEPVHCSPIPFPLLFPFPYLIYIALSLVIFFQQKWLIRIIMRDLKIGLSENSVFGLYHPDAMDLFTVCSSLEKVSCDLLSLDTHLNEASITLCTPFRPMLGQRATIDQVWTTVCVGVRVGVVACGGESGCALMDFCTSLIHLL